MPQFKAKLIENQQYFQLRRKDFFLELVPVTVIYVIFFFNQPPIWAWVLLGVVSNLLFALRFRLAKRIGAMFGNTMIQLTNEQVIIDGQNEKKQELINLDTIDKIMVMNNYSLPDETITDLKKKILGQPKKNAIVLQQNGKHRTFHFELDSYYSVNQLQKVIDQWQLKGYPVIRKDESYFNNATQVAKSIAS